MHAPRRPTELLVSVSILLAVSQTARPQAQFDTLRALPVFRYFTYAAATGDLDGDGDTDLVFLLSHSDFVGLNDGYGNLTYVRLPSTPLATGSDIALADVDGDTDLDIVVVDRFANRIYINDGSANFSEEAGSRFPASSADSRAAAITDVDGDADPDLVIGNAGQDQLLLNDGTGFFVEVTASHFPQNQDFTLDCAPADVDGDGDTDLVWGGRNRVYLNDGTGRFRDGTATSLPSPNAVASFLAAGDVDRDGDTDLVLVYYGIKALYLNDGSGTFTEARGALPGAVALSTSMVLDDLDGDTDLDAVFANRSGPSTLHLNDGTGRFVSAPPATWPGPTDVSAITAGDFDGDDDLDLLVGRASQDLLLRNRGRAEFVDGTVGPAGLEWRPGIHSLSVADFDADGDSDVVAARTLEVLYYLNRGDGALEDVTSGRLPNTSLISLAVAGLAAGDVDSDGDPDLVVANRAGPNLLYLNDGAGRFGHAPSGSLRSRLATALALADVDNDGDPDLLLTQSDSNVNQKLSLLTNQNGTFQFVAGAVPVYTTLPNTLVTGDVDADGDVDLVLGYSGQNRLLLNDGTGTFIDSTATHLPPDADASTALALGDVDADGDVDLIVGNGGMGASRPQQSRLYLNDGSGRFRDATSGRLPRIDAAVGSLALGDVDADGDLDLVVANITSTFQASGNLLYLNDGSGSFHDVTGARWQDDSLTQCVALADLDGDSDPEILAGGVHWNLHRHVLARTEPVLGRRFVLEMIAEPGYGSSLLVALPALATSLAPTAVPTPFGNLFLAPAAGVTLPFGSLPQPAGRTAVVLAVPPSPGLLGLNLFVQALVIDVIAGGGRLTNYVWDRVR